MYHLVVVLILFAFTAVSVAQEQTLLKSDEGGGGFGAAVFKYTSIKDQGAIMFGGRGGWVINHSLLIGGGIYSIVSKVDAQEGVLPLEGPLNVDLSYFGLETEYIIKPADLWHFTTYIFVGAGSTRYVKDVGSVFKSSEQSGESDIVFVTEPAVNVELNITNWFHVNTGLSYRLVTGVNQPGLESSDFSGITGTLAFKFGKF